MNTLKNFKKAKKITLFAAFAFAFLLVGQMFTVLAMQNYTVQKGDNLSNIAKKFKVSVKDLLHANKKVKNPKALRVGKAILIPEKKGSAKTPAQSKATQKSVSKNKTIAAKTTKPANLKTIKMVKYTLKKGDNIWTLSKKFNASTKEIKRLNKLAGNKIKSGKTIVIPSKIAVSPKKKPSSSTVSKSVTVIHGTQVTKAVQKDGAKHYDVEAGPEVSATPKIFRFIKGENVRVRKGPGIEFEELGYLTFGTKIEVLEKEGNWAKVKMQNGEGWCLNVFLSLAKPVRTEQESDVFASTPHQKVIQLAKAYLGVRYHWGGITSRGFDCSGFVLAMYRKIGVSLPHSASAQFNIGTPVAFNNLKPGDRVYFHTYKRGASHVGLYIGGGKFIHASSAKRGVIISSLFENYYSKRYLGARR